MENNTESSMQPTTTPQLEYSAPPQPGTGVWISREEYDRLRSTEKQAHFQPTAMGSGPLPEEPYEAPKQKFKDFWTYAAALVAILVFLGLTSNFGSLFSVPLTIGLVTFAVLAISSLFKALRGNETLNGNFTTPKNTAGETVIKIFGVILLVPILMVAGVIVFFMILLSSPGAKGS